MPKVRQHKAGRLSNNFSSLGNVLFVRLAYVPQTMHPLIMWTPQPAQVESTYLKSTVTTDILGDDARDALLIITHERQPKQQTIRKGGTAASFTNIQQTKTEVHQTLSWQQFLSSEQFACQVGILLTSFSVVSMCHPHLLSDFILFPPHFLNVINTYVIHCC